MPSNPLGYYTFRLEALREEFGGKCICCSSRRSLEFAHLRNTGLWGRGRGLPQRVHDIQRNKKDYVLLCKACHRVFDQGRRLE